MGHSLSMAQSVAHRRRYRLDRRGITITIINPRIAREQNLAALGVFSRYASFVGVAVLCPSAGVTLLAGIAMVALSSMGFAPEYPHWGFGAVILSVLLGAILIRRATEPLAQLAATRVGGDSDIGALQQRLLTSNTINILILLSAVVAMALKPTL